MTIQIKPSQSFSLYSPEFINNPYPFYDQLRSVDPICWIHSLKYPGWYITGYEEAVAALKDTRLFNRIPLPETTKKYDHLKNIQNDMMLFKNKEDHKRLRLLVSKAFTQKAIEYYRPYIEETVHHLLDEVSGRKTMDVVLDFAFPLASSVIAKILGIPEKDRQRFREWAVDLIQAIDFTRSRRELLNGNETVMKLMIFFKELIHKRRQAPHDDVISYLIKEEEQGDKLTNNEIVSTCILLVIAGHETTVNLISNSILSLLNHQEQLSILKENPFLIEKAVEEFLRYESPTQMVARTASETLNLNGKTIKKGEQVYILLGAANRDPKKFEKANELEINRDPNPHLAFGYGSHFCIGSQLARFEAQVSIQTFVQKMNRLQLVHPSPQWRSLIGFRSLEELLITFDLD